MKEGSKVKVIFMDGDSLEGRHAGQNITGIFISTNMDKKISCILAPFTNIKEVVYYA